MILTCKQLVRAVTDAREKRLSALDRFGYQAHLLRCRHCRRYVAQMDAVVEALHGVLSFFFNLTVLALTVNMISNLL